MTCSGALFLILLAQCSMRIMNVVGMHKHHLLYIYIYIYINVAIPSCHCGLDAGSPMSGGSCRCLRGSPVQLPEFVGCHRSELRRPSSLVLSLNYFIMLYWFGQLSWTQPSGLYLCVCVCVCMRACVRVCESQSRIYPHMRAKFGRGPTFVSKRGVMIMKLLQLCQIQLPTMCQLLVCRVQNCQQCVTFFFLSSGPINC